MCPSLRIEPVLESYSTWLARIRRSPWVASTLPLRVALPLTPSVASSLLMLIGPLALGSVAGAPGAAVAADVGALVPDCAAAAVAGGCTFCDGQGGSSARATGMMLPHDAITIQNGLERSMNRAAL